jgi:hypothetical protein
MKNNIVEIGARAFGGPNIKPDIKVGDLVFVKWANNQTYKGIIKDKLRKNWAVEIQDDNWRHRTNNASVPGYALIKRNFA